MLIISHYGPKVESIPLEFEPTRTKQSFKDECDINVIMAKMATTGVLPELIKENPQYGDFSEAPDYLMAQTIVLKANEQFDALPSKVRNRFHNEPSEFLAFASDASNAKEMVSLGLAVERVVDDVKNKAAKVKKTTPSPAASPASAEGPKS